jgi:hypothetical protein
VDLGAELSQPAEVRLVEAAEEWDSPRRTDVPSCGADVASATRVASLCRGPGV